MKQRKMAFVRLLILGMMLSFVEPCLAHPKANEHNKELEAVLFVNGYSKYQSDEIKNNIKCIEAASYLTIDQFGGNGKNCFEFLREYDMGGLPLFFSSIDYAEDLQGNGKLINPNTHRLYTHQGWAREYETKTVRKFWNARKKILLGTVDTVFELKGNGLFGYSDECDALSGIIYYVHILGDYDEADNYKKVSLLTDLAGHDSTDKNDMITELKTYVEILFSNQKKSNHYKELMDGLDDVYDDAEKLVKSVGGVNTDDEFEEYHQCADDLLELLIKHIPELLKKEKFYKEIFYFGN